MNGLLAAESQETYRGGTIVPTVTGSGARGILLPRCVTLLPEMNGRKPFSEGRGGGTREGSLLLFLPEYLLFIETRAPHLSFSPVPPSLSPLPFSVSLHLPHPQSLLSCFRKNIKK